MFYCVPVETVNSFRYVGSVFDCRLKWDVNMISMCTFNSWIVFQSAQQHWAVFISHSLKVFHFFPSYAGFTVFCPWYEQFEPYCPYFSKVIGVKHRNLDSFLWSANCQKSLQHFVHTRTCPSRRICYIEFRQANILCLYAKAIGTWNGLQPLQSTCSTIDYRLIVSCMCAWVCDIGVP